MPKNKENGVWPLRWHDGRIWSGVLLCGFLAMSSGLGGCSSASSPNPKLVDYGQNVPKGGGYYKVGKPYKISGKMYYPKVDPRYKETGVASWYGRDFHGRRTANGEIYDMDSLTAAHRTLPMPTFVRVKNLANGRQVVLRVNDRGPFAHSRIIDVSARAAKILGFKQQGTARVEVSYLGKAPLDGKDGWMPSREPQKSVPGNLQDPSMPSNVALTTTPPIRQSPAEVAPSPSIGAPSIRAGQVAMSTASSGAPSTKLAVQAASFTDPGHAQDLARRIGAFGPTNVQPVQVNGITYYRVRLGPFTDQAQASHAMQKLSESGLNDARLVPH